ncbi:MAG: hypothetical protein ACYDH9_06475 [Limisphaerales bacterium]
MDHPHHKLTDREQRTIRRAALAIALYLVLFYGWRGWKQLEKTRTEYQQLVRDALTLKVEVQRYETKVLLAKKLMDGFRMDPAKLSKAAAVAEASAAIQKAATTGGIQLGPIRESPARPSAKESAAVQLEGSGPAPAVMTFLQRLETLGYPLILDSVQINADPARPGTVKVNLTIVIMDFEQWKSEETRNA